MIDRLLAEQIVAAVAGKKDISLPYLQVYLDQLWRDDYKRTFPDGYEGEGFAPLEFTTEEIRQFGKIKNVLLRFLKQQKKDIQVELKAAFPQLAREWNQERNTGHSPYEHAPEDNQEVWWKDASGREWQETIKSRVLKATTLRADGDATPYG